MIMKPSATFKLSKETKRSLALGRWKNKDQRDAWKRSMIQAELAAAVQPRVSRERKAGS
jgi:hypothetical protein